MSVHPKPAGFPSYIRGLDGMRAVSVLLVILGHCGFEAVPSAIGVTIFFFVSGFLITNLLITEYGEKDGIDIRAFYVRRYLRLMPEMGFYVVIGILYGLVTGVMPALLNILGALFYFTNYIAAFSIKGGVSPFTFGHFWSLAVEEHFYLSWPLLFAACMPNPKRLLLAIGAVLVTCLVWRLFVVTSGILPVRYVYFASDARFDSIAYGCLCAALFRYHPQLLIRMKTYPLLLLATGVVVLLIPMSWRHFLGLNVTFQEAIRYTVQGTGFILCFIYLYVGKSSRIIDLLEMKIMRIIGRSSYGMYIWHYAIVYTLTLAMGFSQPEGLPTRAKIMTAVIAVPLATLLGYLSATYVLAPFSKLRRRFGSHVMQVGHQPPVGEIADPAPLPPPLAPNRA